MTLALYDHPDSSNALKVRFLLAELGLDYERRTVSMATPRAADYLAVNPLGGIPALDDDGYVLAESQAILRYLADREGRDDLYPRDPRDRGRVDEFLDRFATRLRTPFFRREAVMLGWTLARGFSEEDAEPEKAPAIEAEIAANTALLDRLVSEQGAVLGRFTIADCALAPVLHRARRTGYSLDAYPRLDALADALLARPAWAAAQPAR
jgi:glutathione S-transferase